MYGAGQVSMQEYNLQSHFSQNYPKIIFLFLIMSLWPFFAGNTQTFSDFLSMSLAFARGIIKKIYVPYITFDLMNTYFQELSNRICFRSESHGWQIITEPPATIGADICKYIRETNII